ncbi:MAG: hypothetical protein H6739_22985 [Alphaproteobacteria bacterium]|nr:hypothetical protein [Alphaproteobacteria bacterium]
MRSSTPAIALLLLAACGGRPLTEDFPAQLFHRGNCGWVFESWSEDADMLLRYRLDAGLFARGEVGETVQATFEYPRTGWNDLEGDLALMTGKDLTGVCDGSVAPRYTYEPFAGRSTLRVQTAYYEEDVEPGCTVARGSVNIEFSEELILQEVDDAADGVVVPPFAVSGSVEVLEGCSFG